MIEINAHVISHVPLQMRYINVGDVWKSKESTAASEKYSIWKLLIYLFLQLENPLKFLAVSRRLYALSTLGLHAASQIRFNREDIFVLFVLVC